MSSNPQITTDSIPVIDITELRSGGDKAQAVATALYRASQDVGFIYISGHGLDPLAIKNAREHAFDFFRQPISTKNDIKVGANHRGFLAQGGAVMGKDQLPDLKESFIFGDNNTYQDHSLRGENRWPLSQPNFVTSAKLWFNSASELAETLLTGFAIGLNLPSKTFLNQSDKPLSRASFVYYPPQEVQQNSLQYGVGPHTDFGVLTILAQDQVGGLEIQTPDGQWLKAPPIEGTLIINVGDLLARWTNNAFRSTPHRVINTSGQERLSLVLAYDPNPETLIDPIALFPETQNPAQPITCGDYLQWRFAKAFQYRQNSQ